MSSDFHTPWTTSTRFRASEMNAPLEQLDQAIVNLTATVEGAAPEVHTHDDRYYTETELSTPSSGATVDFTNLANVPPLGTGDGSVTSVALALPVELTVTGSPITGAGTLTGAWATQAPAKVFATPVDGADAAPAFRPLVQTDLPAQPFDVHVYIPGVLTDAMEIINVPLARAVTFLASFTGSYATGVAATAETILTISKNGSSIGTITFAAAGTTGTFAGAGGSFAAGDLLSIEGPATADATLADIGLVLAGTR